MTAPNKQHSIRTISPISRGHLFNSWKRYVLTIFLYILYIKESFYYSRNKLLILKLILPSSKYFTSITRVMLDGLISSVKSLTDL